MSRQVQIRRGTTAQHAAFTGAQGELSYNTTTKRLHTHDGSTVGGAVHALLAEMQSGDTAAQAAAEATAAAALASQVVAYAGTGSGQGASQVGLQDADDHFTATDIEGAIRELAEQDNQFLTWVNVLRYIPAAERAAIRAGTSTTDLATYIQAAFNDLKAAARGGTLFAPPGDYPVTTCPLVWDTGGASVSISIKGAGQKATRFKKLGTTTTTVLPCTVTALNNGTFMTMEDFTVQGISTCNGVDMTLFARYQTKNLGITGCAVGMNSVGSLIGSHYDPYFQGNVTGFKCVGSGSVKPNLVQFFGGSVFQNTSWGMDLGDGDSIFVYGTDIELNGTAGNTATGGAVLRSTLGSSGSNCTIGFNGGWFEANNGNGLLVEANAGLSLSLRDTKHVNSEANNEITCGAIRSLHIDNAQANAFGDAFTIGAVQSLIIRGGSVWTLTNSAVSWELHGVVVAGSLVKYRVGGSATGLETYNQNGARHNSGTSSVSALTATATTLFTVSGAGARMISVYVCLGGAGSSYTANARYAWDGTNLVRMGGDNAVNMTLTASGANVQATQSSGITQSIFYVADVIGA